MIYEEIISDIQRYQEERIRRYEKAVNFKRAIYSEIIAMPRKEVDALVMRTIISMHKEDKDKYPVVPKLDSDGKPIGWMVRIR